MEQEVMEPQKIILPEDKNLVDKLKRKLLEYSKRAEDFAYRLNQNNQCMHPDLKRIIFLSSDHYCKMLVLSEVLENKEVCTWGLSKSFLEDCVEIGDADVRLDKDVFDIFIINYENACAVIDEYCKTGGKNNCGGTGLN